MLSTLAYALQRGILLRRENPYLAPVAAARRGFENLRRRNTIVGGRCAPPSALLVIIRTFLPRDLLYKRGLCRHAVSVCLCVYECVCLSHSWIVSKRIKISSIFFHRRVATPFWFFLAKQHSNIKTETPLMGT